MKRMLLPVILTVGTYALHAQSAASKPGVPPAPRAYESQVNYQKTVQQAALIDVPYTEDITEASIKDYMSQKGWKSSSSRGYVVFRNVRLADTAAVLNDVHIKVDRKSRGANASVVTALIVRPGEDPSTRTNRDEAEMLQGRLFLEKMVPAIVAGDLEVRIKDQESTAKKSQSKLADLRDDQLDLEKKIKNTQADLDKNKADQVKETQAQQSPQDAKASEKSMKHMKSLISDQGSLQGKAQKYQAQLEQNKKQQQLQESSAAQEQHALDSLRALRKN